MLRNSANWLQTFNNKKFQIYFLFLDTDNKGPQLFPVLCCWKTLLWVKLSNSGNTLKRLILSYWRKLICGWSNDPGKVITQTMTENEMGYRGSKSVLLQLISYREAFFPPRRGALSLVSFLIKLIRRDANAIKIKARRCDGEAGAN